MKLLRSSTVDQFLKVGGIPKKVKNGTGGVYTECA